MTFCRLSLVALLIITAVLSITNAGYGAGVLYVKQDSPGPVFDGQSWETAFHKVQDAANAADYSVKEIWVARGTYNENIKLSDAISLYGGFAGDESDKSQRDPQRNVTILDGCGISAVVVYSYYNSNARVDGFTVRNGYSAGIHFNGYGTGLVSNCVVTDNISSYGAINAVDAVAVNNCVISRNSAHYGTIYAPNAIATNCTISDNNCSAISCTTSVVVDRCRIESNEGGIRCGYTNQSGTAQYARVTNCTIANNYGYDSKFNYVIGGAIAFRASNTNTYDCILAGNVIYSNNVDGNKSAVSIINARVNVVNNSLVLNGLIDEGAMSFDQCTGTVANNIVAFNTSGIKWTGGSLSFTNNCVYKNKTFNYSGGDDPTGTQGNISADPGFASMVAGDLHIQPDSTCIGAGDDTAASVIYSDIDGHVRIFGDHVDIGADESNGITWPEKQVGTVYVSPKGSDSNDGSSWAKAKKTIQAGIDSTADKAAEVWVAGGTYNERINLKPRAWLYGGFAGNETDRAQRDWKTNKTVIDGIPAEGEDGGSVITALGIPSNLSCLDGFTVRGGNGTPIPIEHNDELNLNWGGGIFCPGSAIEIANNTVTENKANCGAGICCLESGAVISNNEVLKNEAHDFGAHYPIIPLNGHGGAVYCSGGAAMIANNIITLNSSVDGSGVYCCGRISISNNTIVDNLSSTNHSDLYAGAIYCADHQPVISSNIIAYNFAGIYNAGASSPTLKNNCVYGNFEYNYRGRPVEIEHATDIEQDPKFASLEYGNIHIQPDSPCVDAGHDDVVLPDSSDMDGQRRVLGQRVDIGADESDSTTWIISPTIIRVGPHGNDDNDGSSWERAKRTVHSAVASLTGKGGEIWVQAGTYYTAGSPLGTLTLPNHVFLYGGFNGTETQRSQRNWAKNETVLAGDKSAAGNYGSVLKIDKYSIYTTVDSFTIRDGNALSNGGGICCELGTRPILANNRIIDNSAGKREGGYIESGYGSGIFCAHGCYPTITGNVIARNTSIGGNTVQVSKRGTVSGNTIADNTNMYSLTCTVHCGYTAKVANNIIAFNSAFNSHSGIAAVIGTPYVINNCLYGNIPHNGSTFPDTGNIFLDPMFVNREAGDYHLSPLSPCLDAGSASFVPLPEFDMDCESRVSFDIVDIGADECGTTPECMGQVKLLKPNDKVRCSGVVTAVFGSLFYIESPNRSGGLMVFMNNHGLVIGDSVVIYGAIQYSSYEKQLYASKIIKSGKGYIEPVLMNNKAVGGANFAYDSTTRTGQMGSKNGTGLNNVGLLVRITGRVVKYGSFFHVDDGSGVLDDPASTGVRLMLPGGLSLAEGSFVSVTGISSVIYSTPAGGMMRMIRVRSQDDVVVLKP